jgi:hypothetical protein
MARSPRHYQHALEHGVTETAAMRIGSAAHALVLGGWRSFAVYDGVRRGREWESFRDAQDGDTTILNAREDETARAVGLAVQSDPDACDLLSGEVERSIAWEVAGRLCIGTPDALTLSKGDLSDLKVTADGNPEKFIWHAARQGWLAQLAWYADGLRSLGRTVNHLHLVAVEAKPPHVVTCYRLTERAEELGRRTWRLLFERLRVCEESDTWPGYAQVIVDLDSPEDLTLQIDGEDVTA